MSDAEHKGGATPPAEERRVEVAMLAEARTDIGYADHKASMVLAALGIGFSAVLGGLFASEWRPTDLTGWAEFFWWVGAACAVASVIFAGLAVWPRIGDPHATDVYYWGDVQPRFDSDRALGAHLDENPIDAVARTRNQLWVISGIVRRKYTMIRRAMRLGVTAIGLLIVAGLIVLLEGRGS
jgi:hypothetical protein